MNNVKPVPKAVSEVLQERAALIDEVTKLQTALGEIIMIADQKEVILIAVKALE